MTRITSTRFGISYPDPALRDERPDVTADLKRVIDALETSGVYFREDTLANRPAAGKHGYFFVSTDESPRVVYYDYGTGWQAVGTLPDNSVSTAKLQDNSVTWQKLANGAVIAGKIAANVVTQTELADNSVGTSEIQGGAVTLAKIAAAVQVYFTDQRVPLNGSVTPAKLSWDPTVYVGAGAMLPAPSGGAQPPVQVSIGNAYVNVMDFLDAQTNISHFQFPLPWDFPSSATVNARFIWTSTSGAGGNAYWLIDGQAIDDGSNLGAAYGGLQGVLDANNGANMYNVSSWTPALTLNWTPAPGAFALLRVYRAGADGNDSFSGTARLIGVQLKYPRT